MNSKTEKILRDLSKQNILLKICYTELVYGRINKKLRTNFNKIEIESLIYNAIEHTPESNFVRKGKNIYIKSIGNNFSITINTNTFRIITVDKF